MRPASTPVWRTAAVRSILIAGLLPGSAWAADSAAAPMLKVAQKTALGNILTDGKGMTLYIFKKDKPGESVCEGQCAQKWPPMVLPEGAKPMAPAGVAGKLGDIERKDDTYQMTYNGMPLYRYAGDTKPGDMNGQGLGGVWFVVPTDASTASTGNAASKGW